MNIESEILKYNVSRETLGKMQEFVRMLSEWNEKINLVSKKSLQDVWVRHVLDSLQLSEYMSPQDKVLLDIGSGSGFPGVVLAIYAAEKLPDMKIILVESIGKKVMYLRDVCQRLGLNNVEVVQNRVENIKITADVVTARAVAELPVLLAYTEKIINKNGKALFLKGKSYNQEMAVAQGIWNYEADIVSNRYSDDGVILKIFAIRKWK